MPSHHKDEWYIERARLLFEKEGFLEIDDFPKVSKTDELDNGDDGAYVQCWVWVDDE